MRWELTIISIKQLHNSPSAFPAKQTGAGKFPQLFTSLNVAKINFSLFFSTNCYKLLLRFLHTKDFDCQNSIKYDLNVCLSFVREDLNRFLVCCLMSPVSQLLMLLVPYAWLLLLQFTMMYVVHGLESQ